MKTYILRFLMVFFILLHSSIVTAAGSGGVGEFANAMIEPVGLVANLITTGSVMIGVGCLFGAF
ncbi:MAG: hypothetical protein JO131_09510, partial [Gammaproteobacteria bacterium]|nr:hypothetical protein [Gammaproteobacteria bacterium]